MTNNFIDAVTVVALIVTSIPVIGLLLHLTISTLSKESLYGFYIRLMHQWFKLP